MKLSLTPEKQAAFEQLKGFVRGVIGAREIEAHKELVEDIVDEDKNR